MPVNADRAIKKARLKALDEFQAEIQARNNATLVGNVYDVLVEGRKRGRLDGRNRGDNLIYLKTPAIHEHQSSSNPRTGQTVLAEITSSSPWSLEAKFLPASYTGEINHADRVNKEKVAVT